MPTNPIPQCSDVPIGDIREMNGAWLHQAAHRPKRRNKLLALNSDHDRLVLGLNTHDQRL
jgi:hypothetical protein